MAAKMAAKPHERAHAGPANPAAAGAGTLYVVATPLGNLGDCSHRLSTTLAEVDGILAEDTRRARILLSHLQLQKPLRPLHAHNERGRSEAVLAQLQAGESLALLTDAGTPAVSDPGAFLVAEAHAAGVRVCPIPGPSALSTALSASGFAHEVADALFVGFLPRSGSERRAARERLANFAGVVVLFESPHRLAATLGELAGDSPGRLACVCRELTKLHEEIVRAPLQELCAWSESKQMRGEVTLVLGPRLAAAGEGGQGPLQGPQLSTAQAVQRCLDAGLRVRDAATAVAALLGVPRKEAYSLALAAGAGDAEG